MRRVRHLARHPKLRTHLKGVVHLKDDQGGTLRLGRSGSSSFSHGEDAEVSAHSTAKCGVGNSGDTVTSHRPARDSPGHQNVRTLPGAVWTIRVTA